LTIAACENLFAIQSFGAKISVCTNLALIAKRLPVDEGLFGLLVQVVEEETEMDLLTITLELLAKVLREHQEYAEFSQELIVKVLDGQIKYLQANALDEASPEFVEYLMTFVAVFVRFGPPNLEQILQFVLEWLHNASHIIQSSLLTVLISATIYCNVPHDVITQSVEILQASAGDVEDVDLRQQICFYFGAAIEKIGFDFLAPWLPVLAKWWSDGKGIVTGQRCQSNIALLILKVAAKLRTVPDQLVLECLAAFPPANITDNNTNVMAVLIMQLLGEQRSPEFVAAAGMAVAKILVEPKPQLQKRKVSEEVFGALEQFFKGIVGGNSHFRDAVTAAFAANQEKQALIAQYFV
jgi:hypothetical protein